MIRKLDRNILETLDNVALYVWNNFEIKWITQQRILAVLFITLGKIPRIVTHKMDISDWIGIILMGSSNIILSLRTPEMHNAMVSVMRPVGIWWRTVLLAMFVCVFIVDLTKDIGVWLYETSNVLWVFAMFYMETYIPTKPPQKKEKRVKLAVAQRATAHT